MKELLTTDSRQWWNRIKDLIGASKSDPVDTFSGMAREYANGDYAQFTNAINTFLHSVSADLPPLKPDNSPTFAAQIENKYLVSIDQVERQFMRVKGVKPQAQMVSRPVCYVI